MWEQCILLIFLLLISDSLNSGESEQTMAPTFLYFAYGSNLLIKRIHINNPTATRAGIGKLKNYRLDFNYKSNRWNGAAATIVPDNNSSVMGALWDIHVDNMEALDRQEGVSLNIYKVVQAKVEMPNGTVVDCRTYQLVDLPPKLGEGKILPLERRPSKPYLDTIIEGAEESGLPIEYINKLKAIPHNGYTGPVYHDLD